MDIAKYIGLFLLKNQFCYVHGLGNLELTKRPATYDGKALQSPSYEVKVTPGGSIDDNLANFIAVNEQISISKAANALRDYSIQSRKDMAAGKEVPLPNIGRFIEQNGKVVFITDDNFKFTPAGIPTIRNSKQLEEQNTRTAHKPSFPAPAKANSVNWTMVIIAIVFIVVLVVGGYGIYYYTSQSKRPTPQQTVPVADTVIEPQQQPAIDTSAIKADTSLAVNIQVPLDSQRVNPYRLVIGEYPTRERAEKRSQNLRLNGNVVETFQVDSTMYLVVTTVNCRFIDTVHVKDSLRSLFGYKNIRLQQQ